jgi:hypothetical protein
MKTALRTLCIIAIITLMGATAVLVIQNQSTATASPENKSPATPAAHGKPLMLAQNENYIACYKQVDMKTVLFRWCPTGYPWTATADNRTLCYATSEACAAAEMPQSWCIKCGNKD